MILAFADSELDLGLFELRRRGQVVKLAPKAFDLLRYLIEHRDRVVSKAELLEKLWPGEHVTESVLPSNVTAVRRALRDERAGARLIQTVHGRGYRFVAPVEERSPDGASPRPQGVFVGRDALLEELESDLGEALAGRTRVTMLAGEPGIGKTRTAEELLALARSRGAEIAVGRGYEGEGAPAFWPWVQVLRFLLVDLPSDRLRELLGPGAAEIVKIVPELALELPDLAGSESRFSDQARFRFYDSVAMLLRNASRSRPLVIFLDDLHWADEPSLLLLQFLSGALRDARLLVLCAYRDVELRRKHPLSLVLGELARGAHFRRAALRGLAESEVGRFVADFTGREPSAELARAVFEMTEGNPFFLHETVQLLAAEGELDSARTRAPAHLALPQGVREVIGRRLDRLSEECNRALTLAAVIGREFPVGVLAMMAGVSNETILELLDEAASAHVITDRSGAREDTPLPLGHLAFRHALIREAIYEELSGPQRVRLHRQVAEILDAAYGPSPEPHLAELAHHFFQAAPGGDVDRAIAYGVRAAEHAQSVLAYEESVAHYERVLQVEDLASPADDERRGALTQGLALALWRAGRYSDARAAFLRVVEIARRTDDCELLARAVLGMGGWPQFRADEPAGGQADAHRALLEEALSRLGDGSTALRAHVVSHLADHRSLSVREARSREAVELARRSGDPDALFAALFSRLTALLGPDDIQRRLEVSKEILALAQKSGSREQIFMARESRLRSLLALGEIADADREIEACAELARELRLPIYHHSLSRFQLARALADCRLEDAERLSRRVMELGRRTEDATAAVQHAAVSQWIAILRGELASPVPAVDALLEELAPLGHLPHALGAFLHAALGDTDGARLYFERVSENDFRDVARDEAWIITLGLCAEACAFLGDARRATSIRALLLPYRDLLVCHQHMRLYFWPVSFSLGLLEATLGEMERAIASFGHAIEASERIGSKLFAGRAQLELARTLLGHSPSRDDRRRARELLGMVETTAGELGVPILGEAAREIA